MKWIISIVLIVITLFASCGYSRSQQLANDDKVSSEILENLVTTLAKDDKEGLNSLFSEEVKNSCKTLAVDTDYLLSFFKGEIINYEENGQEFIEENDYGKTIKKLVTSVDIETTDGKYSMFLVYYIQHDSKPDFEGLYALRVIKSEDEENGNLWGYYEDMELPGVFNPKTGDGSVS